MRGRLGDAFVVVLAVACGALLLSVNVRGEIPLRDYEHPAGFRVPVPAEWFLSQDEDVEGYVFEAILTGPHHDGFTTTIVIDTDVDPRARESNAYLSQFVDAAVQGTPDSYVTQGPTYRTIAGHAGVVFTTTEPTPSPTTLARFAIVVSADHDRYWLLVLRAHADYFELYGPTFDQMVESFEITARPTPSPQFGSGAALGVVVLFVIVGIVLVVFIASRRRRPAPSAPRTIPLTYGPPATTIGGPKFCSACGMPAATLSRFCVRCGSPFVPASISAPAFAQTTPAGSETPPPPPPPP